jgi:diguanylate cyclase (GGDEF)-like protein
MKRRKMDGKKIDSNDIVEDARFIEEINLDYDLMKVFCGEAEGTQAQRKKIAALRKELKDKIYVELIYVLMHNIIRSPGIAKSIYKKIEEHKKTLTDKLGRNPGIEVAALDFAKNIYPLLEEPKIIEEKKVEKFAEQTIKDDITGMYDRDTLQADLSQEIKRSKRYKRPLSVLFCDLDGFKKINDKYGHPAGDKILKASTSIFKKLLRKIDKVYRYGGEEFVCVLAETNIEEARAAAERIREDFERREIPVGREKIGITISIGAARYKKAHKNPQDLIAAADKAMYLAKKAGKNCVKTA